MTTRIRNNWIVIATLTGVLLFAALGLIEKEIVSDTLAGTGVVGALLLLLLREPSDK